MGIKCPLQYDAGEAVHITKEQILRKFMHRDHKYIILIKKITKSPCMTKGVVKRFERKTTATVLLPRTAVIRPSGVCQTIYRLV